MPWIHSARRWARTGGISSGPSSRRSRGRPAVAARRATRSGVWSPRSAGWPPRAAATIRAARSRVRRAASATEPSASARSAPRSHSVGAGRSVRARRAARAASSVVRPLPGAPTRASTLRSPSVKAANSLAWRARSTGSGPDCGAAWPTEVAVSSRMPAGLRSAPYAGTVAALRASSSPRGPSAGRSGTAKAASRCAECRAVPTTPRTAPVRASSTGAPAAPPPSRRASRPPVPMASSSASWSRWKRSVAVYVTSVAASTRA